MARRAAAPPQPAAPPPPPPPEPAEETAPAPAAPANTKPVEQPTVAIDPALVPPEALFKILAQAWRALADAETPTLLQLQQHKILRVEVDAPSGFVAVVTEEDTFRIIGYRRELLPYLVSNLTRHTPKDITAMLSKGPAKIEALAKK